VLENDFSGFVQLIPAASPDHFVMADGLVDWYSRFGVPTPQSIDEGSHLKDNVIK
jgi:hypothetical protein